MLFCYDHANEWKWISLLTQREVGYDSRCRGIGYDIQVSWYSRLSGVLAANDVQVRARSQEKIGLNINILSDGSREAAAAGLTARPCAPPPAGSWRSPP